MIPDDQVEEVRARADIVEVVGEYVDLKKSGKDWVGRCPFHEERTPSFNVVPAKGFYHCFGCGESGDVFAFVMKRSGLDFVEAVKQVAGKAGVQIREVKAGREGEEDPNRPLYELNAFARDFYRRTLLDPEVGRNARDYLASRDIDDETAERFGLGYAPDGWRALREAAAKHGFDDALLLEAGLLSTSEKSPEPYDRFRDRVIFPIEGLTGRVVAFGGRVLGKGESGPKYMNSPETPVYHKGDVLYGLSAAKHAVRREGAAVVVEGYMDVVSLVAAGFENVVAPLGTALTEAQASLLSRYAKRVYLLFDSDPAGLRATFKSGDLLLATGVHPSVVTLPPRDDPDTLVRREGAEGLRRHLDEAVDVLDRKLRILEENGWFEDIEKIRQAVDRLLPTLRATSDPALRDIYVAKVAERTGVRRETLEEEAKRARRASSPPAADRPTRGAPRRTVPRLPPMGAERSLLLLLLKDRDWVVRASERLRPEDFADAAHRAIFQMLLDEPDAQAPPPGMDPVAARRLEELLADPQELAGAGEVFESSVGRITLAALERRAGELERRIDAASTEEEKAALLADKVALSAERRAIGDDWSHAARKLRAGAQRHSL